MFDLNNVTVLTKAQQKNIRGGGSCGFKITTGKYAGYSKCGVSKEEALAYNNYYGGYWCCDSCGESSYCS